MMVRATSYLHWIRNRSRMGALPWSRREQSAIIIALFHGLFRSRGEAARGTCDPQQGITVAFFTEFVETLLGQGVAIRELGEAVTRPQPGLAAVITFDDGYYSNVHALDVLERFAVPATFFISTRHVQEQKSFWWDAVYRQAARRGIGGTVVRRRTKSFKRLRAEEIDSRLVQWFGPQALVPVSDCDRPFSERELADFASSRYVFLGNHTSDHARLVNYEPEGIRDQIEGAQRFLTGITGMAPRSIAYPHGDYDGRAVTIARDLGLEFGLTIRTGLNVPGTQRQMELRRLTVWGVPVAKRQVKVLASAAAIGR